MKAKPPPNRPIFLEVSDLITGFISFRFWSVQVRHKSHKMNPAKWSWNSLDRTGLTVHRFIFFAVMWMLFETYLPVMLNPIPICILSTLYYRAEGFVVTPQKQKKHSAKTIHAVVTPPKQSNEDGSKAKFKYQPSEFCSTRSCSCVVSLHLSLSKTNTNINTICHNTNINM